MRGEPEIGVQNRAQHLHGVASERQVMRDDQRHKSCQRPDSRAQTEPVNALQEQTEHHRAPTNENGG